METPEKGLQKFTESSLAKMQAVFEMAVIQRADFDSLTPEECTEVCNRLTDQLNAAKGNELDRVVRKIENVVPQTVKNQIWERNHNKITHALSTLTQDYGRMPTKDELATKTELSRQTIHKHLKEYASHPMYLGQIEQFRFLTSKVLAKVFEFAVNGDTKAAKLYFELMGNVNGQSLSPPKVKNQNNYIQINNTLLTEEVVRRLTAEQLRNIENIIKI